MMHRIALCLAIVTGACGSRARARPSVDADAAAAPAVATAGDAAGDATLDFTPRHWRIPDTATAVRQILRDRPRVLGIGEIHERVDRRSTSTPTLVRFAREILPAVAAETSDLVIETWTLEPGCKTGVANSQRIESSMKRPASTGSQISSLFGITKANAITAHVMRLTCRDLESAVTADGVDPVRLLDLVTRELGRIAVSAVRYRDEHQETRPLVVVYGGALHNDLYPPRSTREWSYALELDLQLGGRYVELDLFRVEQVRGVELYEREPWYPLLDKAGPDHVVLIERAPHAYTIVLPTEP